jgi:hypothetical protein
MNKKSLTFISFWFALRVKVTFSIAFQLVVKEGHLNGYLKHLKSNLPSLLKLIRSRIVSLSLLKGDAKNGTLLSLLKKLQ